MQTRHPVIDQYSDEYSAGMKAFNSGVPLRACPYPTGSLHTHVQEARMSWISGWLTQRSRVKFRTLWVKYGIEF
jgi:hypothetical protein